MLSLSKHEKPFSAESSWKPDPLMTPLEVNVFKDLLMRRGFQVNVRKSKGQDVQAACGQLRAEFQSECVNPESGYIEHGV